MRPNRLLPHYKLKITNTYLKHKNIHKFMWKARGMKSIMDYLKK